MAEEMMKVAGRGADGKSKAIKTSIDGTLEVKNVINYKTLSVNNIDSLNPGDRITLVDVNYPVIIDYFDWLARHETDAKIEFNLLPTFNNNGTSVIYQPSPRDLLLSKSIHFNIVEYDTTATPDPKFRFQNKKEMYFPEGLTITLLNTSTDKTFRNSCVLRGRRFGI